MVPNQSPEYRPHRRAAALWSAAVWEAQAPAAAFRPQASALPVRGQERRQAPCPALPVAFPFFPFCRCHNIRFRGSCGVRWYWGGSFLPCVWLRPHSGTQGQACLLYTSYRDAVTAKCRELLTAIVRPALAVRYVVALGRRDLLWDLLPEYIEKNVLEVRDD